MFDDFIVILMYVMLIVFDYGCLVVFYMDVLGFIFRFECEV